MTEQTISFQVGNAIAKQCARCGAYKPADALHYYRNPAAHDDMQATCIECCRAARRERWRDMMARRMEAA